MAAKYLILVTAALFFGGVSADSLLNSTLPQEIQANLDPQEIGNLGNKSIAEFKSQCERNGGPDAFENAYSASQVLVECMSGLVNMSQLQAEVAEAEPNGRLDEVFKKYCDKNSLFESCAGSFINSTLDCWVEEEQNHLKTLNNITKQLVNFMCDKDGDRLALFIAEGGRECIQNKSEELQACWNQTIGSEIQKYVEAAVGFRLTFNETQCNTLTELQHCFVRELDQCPKSTSANIAGSIFKFIRKSTECKNFPDGDEVSTSTGKSATITDVDDKQSGTASSLAVTSATIIMAAATAIFL